MRVKNEKILAKIGEENSNSKSRESLDFTGFSGDLEQVYGCVLRLRLRVSLGFKFPQGVPPKNAESMIYNAFGVFLFFVFNI